MARRLDEPDFEAGIWRTARKRHHCWTCKGSIEPGQRYWEYLGESALYESGTPYCPPCAKKDGPAGRERASPHPTPGPS